MNFFKFWPKIVFFYILRVIWRFWLTVWVKMQKNMLILFRIFFSSKKNRGKIAESWYFWSYSRLKRDRYEYCCETSVWDKRLSCNKNQNISLIVITNALKIHRSCNSFLLHKTSYWQRNWNFRRKKH